MADCKWSSYRTYAYGKSHQNWLNEEVILSQFANVRDKHLAYRESMQKYSKEVVITKNGRPAAVLVSPDEFEGWRETIAIKADGDLMCEIKKGIVALKKKSKVYTLEELFE